MAQLVEQLQSKEPFYVRCIKPNEDKSSSKFNDERVQHQVSVAKRKDMYRLLAFFFII